MDYGYKPTTNGRALITKCMALEKPLVLTRVAVGSGQVPEGTNLADVHEIISYVADGSIGERTHKEDRLYFTVQYATSAHPDVPTFYLSEFIVYAQDPETGEDVDVLYATLGDYKQPVPAFSPSLPPSVWSFPVVLVVSDEIDVAITASPGIVTHDELEREVPRIVTEKVTPAMIGAASVQIGGTEPTAPYTLWFNTGAASLTVATLSLNDDAAGTEVSAIVDEEEYGVENASVNAAPAGNSYDFTII